MYYQITEERDTTPSTVCLTSNEDAEHYDLDQEHDAAPLVPCTACQGPAGTVEGLDYLLMDILPHLPEGKADKLLSCLGEKEIVHEDLLRRFRQLRSEGYAVREEPEPEYPAGSPSPAARPQPAVPLSAAPEEFCTASARGPDGAEATTQEESGLATARAAADVDAESESESKPEDAESAGAPSRGPSPKPRAATQGHGRVAAAGQPPREHWRAEPACAPGPAARVEAAAQQRGRGGAADGPCCAWADLAIEPTRKPAAQLEAAAQQRGGLGGLWRVACREAHASPRFSWYAGIQVKTLIQAFEHGISGSSGVSGSSEQKERFHNVPDQQEIDFTITRDHKGLAGYKIPNVGHLAVLGIDLDGPAYRAGMRKGYVDWIITHVDGFEVTSETGRAALNATRGPDRTFTIRVKRPDKDRGLSALALGARATDRGAASPTVAKTPWGPRRTGARATAGGAPAQPAAGHLRSRAYRPER